MMMVVLTDWLALLVHNTGPALPNPDWMRFSTALGWAVVLAWAGAALGGTLALRRVMAVVLVAWAFVPGPASPTYWLGLAFHAPSITTVLVCATLLQRSLRRIPLHARLGLRPGQRSPLPGWALLGVVLGYLQMFDTFALLPVPLYAWGFGWQSVALVLVLVLLPFLGRRALERTVRVQHALLPCVVVLFALTRLPSGNVWDALLDPLLWLALHLVVLRAIRD